MVILPEEESQSLKNKTNRVNIQMAAIAIYNNIAGLSANQRPAFSGWSVGHVTHRLHCIIYNNIAGLSANQHSAFSSTILQQTGCVR